MKKTLTGLLALLLLVGTAFGQIQFFKFQSGEKTPLQEGERVEITVNAKGQPSTNVLLRINKTQFQQDNNYDQIFVQLEPTEAVDSRRRPDNTWIALSHPQIVKQYANKEFIDFYLFEDTAGEDSNTDLFLRKMKFTSPLEPVSFQMEILCAYLSGTEEYFKDGAWKTSYNYSDLESQKQWKSPVISFTYSQEFTFDRKYRYLVGEGYGIAEGLVGYKSINSKLEKQAKSLASKSMVVKGMSMGTFKKLGTKLDLVREYFTAQIEGTKNQMEAVKLVEAYNNAAKYMMVRNLKSDQLTPLSKELKKVSDPNTIVAAFKKHINPVDITNN